MRQTLSPPLLDPRILIAMKLKGMKLIENTSEHIDTIKLSTLKMLDVRVVIGINATLHILLPIKARQCAASKTHLNFSYQSDSYL